MMLAEKTQLLAYQVPRCRLTRTAVDLADLQAGLKKMMSKKMAGMLQNAPFKFAPENGLAYFEDLGWRTVEVESLLVAARRFHRLPMCLVAWLPQPDPRHPGSRPWSAVALLAH